MNQYEGRVKEVIVDSRINKVIAMRTDSVAMLEALDSISEFYVSNTVEARRALRQDLEFQNINLAKKFLVEFDQVKQRIDVAQEHASSLEGACKALASRMTEADENMKQFMEKASELENKRNYLVQQSKEIEQFLAKFQLSDDEIEILHNLPIDSPKNSKLFFEALLRLRKSHADCKVMVEKHCFSAGFELLDGLSRHQDMVNQRLFEFVKSKCDALAETPAIAEDIDVVLQTSIRHLRRVPVYFSQCQDLVVNARRSYLVQKFVVALTQGGASGFRAIDLHAHDPVRYVGDMLAWMHQTVASEEEFLEGIFGANQIDQQAKIIKRGPNSSGGVATTPKKGSAEPSVTSPRSGDQLTPQGSSQRRFGFEDSETGLSEMSTPGLSVTELLARSLQGLGRPLRVRITQTLESRTSLETLYVLTDLLTFYETTFGRLISMENAVHSAVKGCLLECKRLFLAMLNKQAELLIQHPSSYPLDLTVTTATRECSRQIREVIRVQAEALSTLPLDQEDKCHVDAVLGCIIQPLLQSCRLSGQSLHPADMAIFMLNNVSALQSEFAAKSSAAASGSLSARTPLVQHVSVTATSSTSLSGMWQELLASEASAWIEVLVKEEATRMLKRSDFDTLVELVETLPGGLLTAELKQRYSNEIVGDILRSFYSSLFTSVATQFERLQDADLRASIRTKITAAVLQAYSKVHEFISRKENEFDVTILSHSAEEVGVLLG